MNQEKRETGGGAELVWYELENGDYVQKRGRSTYPPGAYAFVNGLYVRTSRIAPSWERLAARPREPEQDIVDRLSEDSFPASDPPPH